MEEDNEKLSSPTLIKALKADGGSNRELAEEAQISFRAIAEARNGFRATDLRGTRKRLGAVSSITRLAIHLNLEPQVVLSELGIIAAEDPAVQRQIERARETVSPRSPGPEDYNQQSIKARELADPKKKTGPLVGIVPWSPFSDIDDGVSVALSIARGVLGSLNPDWDRDGTIWKERSFGEAEKRLLSDDAGTPELLIGLYDLPWRRRGDVDVVALPGLYVKVGGLCTRAVGWKEILTGRDKRDPETGRVQPRPHALVIEGDVGDKLFSGPVDYPDARLIKPRLTTAEPQEIAERIKYEVTHRSQPNDLLFVADGPLVSMVKARLAELNVKMLEIGDQGWAPVCRFGFAVRIDAPRFKELIEGAISQDLLGRVFPRTAYLYWRLLRSDRSGHLRLNLAELRSPFHPDGDSKFLKLAEEFDAEWESLIGHAVMDRPAFDTLVKLERDKKTNDKANFC